jgi:hypothetical protein
MGDKISDGQRMQGSFWEILLVKLIDCTYISRPLSTIQDIGNLVVPVWDMKVVVISGSSYSLNDVKNSLLMPIATSKPQIHSALVASCVSCPSLLLESFKEETLTDQLSRQLIQWARDKKNFGIDRTKNTVWLSKIYQDNLKDFEGQTGGKLIDFLLTPGLLEASDTAYLNENRNLVKFEYLGFNWMLNHVLFQ